MNLVESKDKYLQYQVLIGNSKRTVENYNEKINYLIKFVGNIDINNFNIDVVNGYIFELMKLNLARETQRTYIRHIKAFVNYLLSEKLINEECKIKIPKENKIIIDILKPHEINMLVNIYDTSNYINHRSKLMIVLLLETGLRKSGLVNLHIKNIDLINKYIKVKEKGEKERLVPLSDYACSEIYNYVYEYNITNYLFLVDKTGLQLTDEGFKSFIGRLKEKSKINRIHAHLFRHTFATYYLIQNNYDIVKLQYILGHTSLKMVTHYLWLAQMYNVVFSDDNRNSVIKGILDLQTKIRQK
jgi:site-specific recombinase XerD